MNGENCFKRYELKYILTKEQLIRLKEEMSPYMREDRFFKSSIMNIYYDTPDFRIIRKSLQKPEYKEKLRLRSYGVLKEDSPSFIEIKKKYRGVVYKRRESLPYSEMEKFLAERKPFSQISAEISYFFKFYKELKPAMEITYLREAYRSFGEDGLRITFDKDILWRTYDMDLTKPAYGTALLSEGTYLMEVKAAGAVPVWLADFLTREKIAKTSFSKYGNAYSDMIKTAAARERLYA